MEKEGSIRIVIADDHSIVREGLRLILSAEPDFEIVGMASDGAEAVQQSRVLRPDILLLDLDMPRMTGLDALLSLSKLEHAVKAIVLTASIENKEIVEALQLGARGVIRKEAPPKVLVECIHRVHDGQYWLGQNAFSDMVRGLQSLNTSSDQVPFGLTGREMEVIHAVLDGETNKVISQRLSISEQTVKNHLTNIFNKVGVSNRLELALFAAKNGLGRR